MYNYKYNVYLLVLLSILITKGLAQEKIDFFATNVYSNTQSTYYYYKNPFDCSSTFYIVINDTRLQNQYINCQISNAPTKRCTISFLNEDTQIYSVSILYSVPTQSKTFTLDITNLDKTIIYLTGPILFKPNDPMIFTCDVLPNGTLGEPLNGGQLISLDDPLLFDSITYIGFF